MLPACWQATEVHQPEGTAAPCLGTGGVPGWQGASHAVWAGHCSCAWLSAHLLAPQLLTLLLQLSKVRSLQGSGSQSS